MTAAELPKSGERWYRGERFVRVDALRAIPRLGLAVEYTVTSADGRWTSHRCRVNVNRFRRLYVRAG